MTFRSTLARRWAACIVCVAAGMPAAWAAPLPGALSVTATAAVDTANSSSSGAATGSASTSSLLGGVGSALASSTSAIFTGTGDAIDAAYSQSGGVGDAATALFIDVSFAIANTSATDTYTLSFDILITQNATVGGFDAFTLNDLSVRDAANAEVFFAFFNRDTLNFTNNDSNPGQGSDPYTITLAPGASTSFTALLGHRGQSLGADSQYSASSSLRISLQDVSLVGGPGPNPVPAPATLALVMLALPLLGATRRARRAALSS